MLRRCLIPVLLGATVAVLASCNSAQGSGTPVATGPTHKVEVKVPPSASVGAEAKVLVSVRPGSSYHMNPKFPTSLEIKPPAGVEVAKLKLGKGDAARLDDDALDFEVKLVPRSAGAKKFEGTLMFAVCTPDKCFPKSETLAWTVNVK